MSLQRCPNCREQNDVSVYVHGQLARCARCGIRFAVDREAKISNPNAQRSPQPASRISSEDTRIPDPHGVVTTAPGSDGQEPAPAGPPSRKPPEPLFPTPADRPNAARAQATPEHTTDAAGTGDKRPNLPGYDAMDLLGRGGMGEVWRARQHSLNRICAIKILAPTLAVEPDFVRRFERESTALAALSHPNIVTVYDRGAANGYWYFVMEFVEGKSLRDRFESRPPRNELLRVLTQTARAIDHAHRKGVIHRDMKPDNVLIDQHGDAKVADFGLAGMSEVGRSSLTMTAVAMGTAHYMAPEQRRDAKNVDGRADIYSLGVMLYEAMVHEIPQGKFPTPRERMPDLDPRLDSLIMRMLDQDPERRPARASEVVEVLEAVQKGPYRNELAAHQGRPTPPLQSMIQRVRKNRPQQIMLAAAGVLLLTALGAGVVGVARSGGGSKHVAAKIDKLPGGKSAAITFGAGLADGVVSAGEGWAGEEQSLERAAGHRSDARAYLQHLPLDFDGSTIEADVEVDGKGETPPFAELALKGEDRDVALRITLADQAEPSLMVCATGKPCTTAAKGLPVKSADNHRYHLELFIANGHVTAQVDHKQVASAQITGLAHLRAKPAFGCEIARCRFSNVRLTGVAGDAVAEKG